MTEDPDGVTWLMIDVNTAFFFRVIAVTFRIKLNSSKLI